MVHYGQGVDRNFFFWYVYRQIEVRAFTRLVLMQVVYNERRKLGTEYEIKAMDLH